MVTKPPLRTDDGITSIEVRTLSGAAHLQDVAEKSVLTQRTLAREVAFFSSVAGSRFCFLRCILGRVC